MTTTYGAPGVKPPDDVLSLLMGPVSRVAREVEIVDRQGNEYITLTDNRVEGGQVTVDQTRNERRSFELQLNNSDGSLRHTTGELWYDKVVRIWRGIEYSDGAGGTDRWLSPAGEFLIDSIVSQHFPSTIAIQGRDWMAQLLSAKFHVPTTFAKNQRVEDVIKTIAQNGGITKFKLVTTGVFTGKDWAFDAQTDRATAIHDIAQNYGLEVFFDGSGFLVLREFRDPSTTPPSFTFAIGPEIGNLVSFKRQSNSSRLYNSVTVIGESNNTTPVYATAQNTVPGSPTSIAEIGERTYFYSSNFITSSVQAQKVANDFLAIHALEEYSMDLESIVFPWLEVGDIVRCEGIGVTPIEPTIFLFNSFTLPLALGSMTSQARRVTKVA